MKVILHVNSVVMEVDDSDPVVATLREYNSDRFDSSKTFEVEEAIRESFGNILNQEMSAGHITISVEDWELVFGE